jgi:hypothetical protein
MTETKKTKLSETDGLQVVVLPEGIHLEGDEVLISQDEATGNITISTIESGNPWTAIFAEIDAIPVSDEDWQRFEDDLENVRTVPLARARVLFDNEDWA